ncbi:MAG TPA: hypothetical protein ENN94_02250 [Geoalkalibacter subterraneus]|uniref:Ribosome association toxin RatA n=1 Tax=Geoalkalibacter subterraneus TaxID=483547 RepID=A0A831LKG9_9BACT|nr:hypothetical protein [Geoalkalibacter subterraneus]
MKLHRLHYVQSLPVDLETCWRFFSDPANLSEITPPWLNFQVTSELPERMQAGMMITYRIRPVLGLPIEWVTEITHADEPRFFVDEQRFGPYRFWHHQHFFRAAEQGVEMEDIVHYALPLGWVAEPIHRTLVAPKLQQIFSYRREILARRFGVCDLPGD